MPSSISSSSPTSAERLTAADRPGVAQPVPERPVPTQPWTKIICSVLIVVTLATVGWELRMRSIGLLAGDYEDGPSQWAEQRRRLDTGEVPVVIVGDSRILFGTDLSRFEALTGVRPVQLALPGTNARPFLEDVAADPDFRGLVILGLSDQSYFRMEGGLRAGALQRYHFESPAQRSSELLGQALSTFAAFTDENYRLSVLVTRQDQGLRGGGFNPYEEPWKYRYAQLDRQNWMWPRLAWDPYLNGQARHFWMLAARRPPIKDEVIDQVIARTVAAVTNIRARGGEVVMLRPPSSGELRPQEERRIARARGWDRLVAATGVPALHFEDDPISRELVTAEMSHLTRECATVYTDSYVRGIALLTDRLKLLPDAPPALTANECPKPPIPSG